MGRRLVSGGGAGAPAAAGGFTLIEVVIAMAITITVMLANLFLFTTAQKNLAFSRALTNATNLATGKIADFRARVIDAAPCFLANTTTPFDPDDVDYAFSGNGSPCVAGDINPDYPGLVNEDFCAPASSRAPGYPLKLADGPSAFPLCGAPGARNPNFVLGASTLGVAQAETTTIDGVPFTSSWVVSAVDLEHDGTPDLQGDVVRVKVDVSWTQANRERRVTMATFITGKTK